MIQLFPNVLQELEREKAARLDQERAARTPSSFVPDQSPIMKQKSGIENGIDTKFTFQYGALQVCVFRCLTIT